MKLMHAIVAYVPGSIAELPMPARYALSIAGAVGTAAVHYLAGRELVGWVPPTAGRVAGMLGVVAAPVVVGTGLVILVNLPSVNASVRAIEASFLIFAVIGALVGGAAKATPYVQHEEPAVPHVGRRFSGADQLRWFDAVAMLLAILIVRLLVRGIPFVP